MPENLIYVPDVPQGSQQINNTQPPIQGNFDYIYQLMAINHINFNTPDIFGNHAVINFVEQSNDPSTGNTDIALYSKKSTSENGIELFYRYPNNGTINQLTGLNSNSGVSGTEGENFQISTSDLPNGGFGYGTYGYWQYLSNGVLIMSMTINNSYSSTKPTSPYTLTIPSGFTNLNTGSIIPSFSQTPFYANIASYTGQPQQTTSGNYAITANSKNTALVYYSGSFGTPPNTIAAINAFFIGV